MQVLRRSSSSRNSTSNPAEAQSLNRPTTSGGSVLRACRRRHRVSSLTAPTVPEPMAFATALERVCPQRLHHYEVVADRRHRARRGSRGMLAGRDQLGVHGHDHDVRPAQVDVRAARDEAGSGGGATRRRDSVANPLRAGSHCVMQPRDIGDLAGMPCPRKGILNQMRRRCNYPPLYTHRRLISSAAYRYWKVKRIPGTARPPVRRRDGATSRM